MRSVMCSIINFLDQWDDSGGCPSGNRAQARGLFFDWRFLRSGQRRVRASPRYPGQRGEDSTSRSERGVGTVGAATSLGPSPGCS